MKTTPKSKAIRFAENDRVVIPPWLRNELDIKEGTRALVYQQGDTIVLKPITAKSIRNLRGSLKGTGLMKSLLEDHRRARELE